MRDLQGLTAERTLLPLDWRYLYAVTVKTLVYADDVKVRWLMLLSSIGWTLAIVLWPSMLLRPYFSKMVALMPPLWWALFFGLHGFGALWRIYDRKERMAWALLVNGLGVAVWAAATTCTNLGAIDHFTASNILEIFACLFLLGTFTSTGFSSKSTSA